MFEGRSEEEVGRLMADRFRDVGAVIVGRRMADLGIGPWGEDPVFHAPVFVVTRRPAETIFKEGGTSYSFVTGGVDDALRQARDAAVRRRPHRRWGGRRTPVPPIGCRR
jgi:dihydrofolate reductase